MFTAINLTGDTGLIVETFKRHDFFNAITFAKEDFFQNPENRCISSLFIAESFIRLENKKKGVKWLKRAVENCDKKYEVLITVYFYAELGADITKKFTKNENGEKICPELYDTILYADYLKWLKIKESEQLLKAGTFIFDENLLTRFFDRLLLLNKSISAIKKVWQLSIIPGTAQVLLGDSEAGIGAFLLTSTLLYGFYVSIKTGGFFELWLLPLFSYTGGNMLYARSLTLKKIRKIYSNFIHDINVSFFYRDKLFFSLINLVGSKK